ncbi:GNAT family N-acetyltransferase [Arthrobacter sp. HLT1-20]
MVLSIRTAVAADAPELATLAGITFPLACPPGSPLEEIETFVAEHLSAQAFNQYLADPLRKLFVAQETSSSGAQRLLAYTMLVDAPPQDADVAAVVAAQDSAELSKCYAHPDTHGSGLSARIMVASLDWARELGRGQVWLGVNQENLRAQGFYTKHGFTIAGTKSFRLGNRVEHDYVMVRPTGMTTTG